MFKRTKIIFLLFLIPVIHGCGTAYKPTSAVLNMSGTLSKEEAMKIVQTAFITPENNMGICKGNGYPGAGITDAGWELNKKTPKPDITPKAISINAYKKIVSYSTRGDSRDIARQGSAGLVSTPSETLSPFRRTINFSDIEKIRILHVTKGHRFTACIVSENQTEIRISLSTGMGHWLSVIIDSKDFEQVIAALMVLAPQAEMILLS